MNFILLTFRRYLPGKRRFYFLLYIIIVFFLSCPNEPVKAQFRPGDLSISTLDWYVWLDEEASWQNDTLHLPSLLDLEKTPSHSPSCGWDSLYNKGTITTLPAVVEELFSGGRPDWTYHGVSWFTTRVDIPATWAGKTVRVYVEKKNSRLEIYVNEKLAGYDIMAGLPYTADVSRFISPGKSNRLAFRITNPGGQRGWNDFPLIPWGSYKILPHHDFGGIGGEVKLLTSDRIYVEDVFAENGLPAGANQLTVNLVIRNQTGDKKPAEYKVRILNQTRDSCVYEYTGHIDISESTTTATSCCFSVPSARRWSPDSPQLYNCEVSLWGNGFEDIITQPFGFRVFEVKRNSQGEENFYLNGKRIRHKSAIDWGYYAHRGYYPDSAMARQSIMAAKAIGHNGINAHRNLADGLLLKYADEMGLIIYEEPGGFNQDIILYYEDNWRQIKTFEGELIREKCLRMVQRDKNHPSVFIYNLANEREVFDLLRKDIMKNMHAVDPTRLIVNQSGGGVGGPSGPIPHLRPYDDAFSLNFMDDHTVGSDSRFMEYDFRFHQSPFDTFKTDISGGIDPLLHKHIVYWGEVRCYAGPDNWFRVSQQASELPDSRPGYDGRSYAPLAKKIEDYYRKNDLPNTGSKMICTPEDVTVQAGRGLMYINGRLEQIMMGNNSTDGFAINGWSGGPHGIPKEHGEWMEWYSAITDEGRNLKGPSSDYVCWNRPLQVAIYRKNGKYFKPDETALFRIALINEGQLAERKCTLLVRIKDGSGKYTAFQWQSEVNLKGDDTFAQGVNDSLAVTMKPSWHAGYITLEGWLMEGDSVLASGFEQVLLQNRPSWQQELKAVPLWVNQWPGASQALLEAGIRNLRTGKPAVILAGEVPAPDVWRKMLEMTRKGAAMIIPFNETWAGFLFDSGILAEKVTQWGGFQKPHWVGNGWGYLDYFVGDQAYPQQSTIGTNGWEVPCDPMGFFPFMASTPQKAYGAWFARPDTLLVLMGEIAFGKGRIILSPGYRVEDNNPFSDLMFFNTIIMPSK